MSPAPQGFTVVLAQPSLTGGENFSEGTYSIDGAGCLTVKTSIVTIYAPGAWVKVVDYGAPNRAT